MENDNTKLQLVRDITKKIIADSAAEAEKLKAEGKTFKLRFGLAPRLNPEARMNFRGAFTDETLSAFCSRAAEEGKLLKDFVPYSPILTGAVEVETKGNYKHYKLTRTAQNGSTMESLIKIDVRSGKAMTPIYYFEEFCPDWIKKKIMNKEIIKTAMLMGQKWYEENVTNKVKPTVTPTEQIEEIL